MIIDMQSVNVEGVMPGPADYPFAALPRQAADIKETVQVTSSRYDDSTVAVVGSADD